MTKKPTYEQLEQRVKELEESLLGCKLLEEKLRESEERYKAVFETAQDSIFVKDRDLRYVRVNPAMERLFGLPASKLLGMTDEDLFGKEAAAHIRGSDNRVLSQEIVEEEHTKPVQGIPITFDLIKVPIRDSSGEVVGLCGIARDITERKQAEEALKQKITQLNSFINNIPDMAWLKDADSRFIAVNAAFGEAVGMAPESLVNKTCEVCFGKEGAKKFREDDLAVMTSRRQEVIEEKIIDSQKNEVWLETIKSPILSESGGILGTVGVARDISKRKLAERALNKKDAELRAKAKNLEEVNTALRVLLQRREDDKGELEEKVMSNVNDLVLPYLEKLKRTPLDRNQKSCAEILESNLKEIILPFSHKLSSKYVGLTPTEIRVANLVKEGKTTKEIAEFMHSSEKTVQTHRDNIRKKIGIKHKKVNLRTYLSSVR